MYFRIIVQIEVKSNSLFSIVGIPLSILLIKLNICIFITSYTTSVSINQTPFKTTREWVSLMYQIAEYIIIKIGLVLK